VERPFYDRKRGVAAFQWRATAGATITAGGDTDMRSSGRMSTPFPRWLADGPLDDVEKAASRHE
jgi:hypothetical protein